MDILKNIGIKNKSKEWQRTLKAMVATKENYENYKHSASIQDCELCKLHHNKLKDRCSRKCPMTAFGQSGCKLRINYAESSKHMILYDEYTLRDGLILFYNNAVSNATKFNSLRGLNIFGKRTKFGKKLVSLDLGAALRVMQIKTSSSIN